MTEPAIKFLQLDADNMGIAKHVETSMGDVVLHLLEQEEGHRRTGPIKLTITAVFERREDGATVHVESKTSAPARIVTHGKFAQLYDGQLLIADATQQELDLTPANVHPLTQNGTETET